MTNILQINVYQNKLCWEPYPSKPQANLYDVEISDELRMRGRAVRHMFYVHRTWLMVRGTPKLYVP